MREILLSQNQIALIDEEDFPIISNYKWYAKKDKKTYYAQTNINENGKRTTLRMHRLLLSAKNSEEIDHKDRNGLNNQRYNINICSRSNNMTNRIFKNSTGFRCVYLIRKTGRFTSSIQSGGKRIRLGCFRTPYEAACAYNDKAKELHGNFAVLNQV